MSMSSMRRELSGDDRGMASFIVVIIMMLVITLIILGFGQVVRTNNREALDKQLSAEAYYAAESGINAASHVVRSQLNLGNAVLSKTTCNPDGAGTGHYMPTATDGILQKNSSGAPTVSFSCLLVNPNPPSLQFTNVTTSTTAVTPINFTNSSGAAANGKALTFTWSAAGSGAQNVTSCNNSSGTKLPVQTAWGCAYALLRVDILPLPSGTFTSDTLTAAAKTFYFEPSTTDTSQALASAAIGNIVKANCTATVTQCVGSIQVTGSNYYVRLSSLYLTSPSVTITGTLASDGSAASFNGAQVLVDATGKAQDVLRRVEVRLPYASVPDAPLNALQSTATICKRFAANAGGTYLNDSACTGY